MIEKREPRERYKEREDVVKVTSKERNLGSNILNEYCTGQGQGKGCCNPDE